MKFDQKSSAMCRAKRLVIILLASLVFGCSNDDTPEPVSEYTYLISADSVNSIPMATLKDLARITGQSEFTDLIRHSITTFRITYHTTYNNEPVEASGLIYFPQDRHGPVPLISMHHATTFVKADAPSASKSFTGMEYFAALGYVGLAADYLGYGSSSDIFHPYYDRQHSALAVIDFIKAAKEFLNEKKIAINSELFFAGYSEGGYVTMAAAFELENNPVQGIQVKAIAAGAGGYSLDKMLTDIITESEYKYPAYLAFVLMSYNETYGWNRPLNYFFQDQYADILETHVYGAYGGDEINKKLTTDLNALLEPGFYARLKSDDGEPELKNALSQNTIGGWNTSVPTRLYHGTEDEVIPYQNSESFLESFETAGSDNVSLTLIEGGTHEGAFVPMLRDFVPWFESIREK